MKTILESEKISLSMCRKILEVNGNKYSDEQIIKIRNWIYNVAEITADYLQSKTKDEILEIERKLKSKKG